MLVSYRWLQELCPVDAEVAEVAGGRVLGATSDALGELDAAEA